MFSSWNMKGHFLHCLELTTNVESLSITSIGAATEVIGCTCNCIFKFLFFFVIFLGYFLHQLFLITDVE